MIGHNHKYLVNETKKKHSVESPFDSSKDNSLLSELNDNVESSPLKRDLRKSEKLNHYLKPSIYGVKYNNGSPGDQQNKNYEGN